MTSAQIILFHCVNITSKIELRTPWPKWSSEKERAEQTIYTQHYAIENRIVFSFRQIRFYNFLYALLKREKCVRKKREASAIYIVPQSTIKSLTLYGKAKFHWLHARCSGQLGRRAGEEENWVWIACYAGLCRVRQEATRPLSGCHKFT